MKSLTPLHWILAVFVLAVAAALPFVLDPRGYAIRIVCLALLFAAMGQAWNIVAGLANQISLGHAAFFGIGAYTSTLLLMHFGLSPWLGMIAAAILGGLAALLISLPTMRLRGHYFALATLAFGEVMRVIGNSWSGLTGGPVGISVPFAPPSLAALQFRDDSHAAQLAEQLLDVFLRQIHLRFAIALLVATAHERVDRHRIRVGRRFGLLNQRAEHATLTRI